MVSQAAARNVVGIIGNVISFGLFLSPVPTFWRIIKAKDTEEFSPNPYLATLLNCMLWVFYGIPVVHPNSILVVTINGIGLVIEAAYLTIFFLYANSNKKRKRALAILVVEFLFMITVVLSVLLAAHTHKKRSLIVGILCIIFGTMMYFSPLTVMKQVVTTKSVEYMPFLLSLASFLNGCCWTIYALMPFDLNLVVPNGLGAVFGLVQLILYACYYKTTPKKQKSVELPTTVATSNVGSGGGGGNVTVTVER